MSTVAEITNALSTLSTQELQLVERSLISIYRQRNTGIIYDDDYGVWTEADQAAVADRAFQMFDKAEEKDQKSGQP